MPRTSTLPKCLKPMLATLIDGPFDNAGWVFEDKYDGFRMVATIEGGKVTLYSRNGKIISHSYVDVAKALEDVRATRSSTESLSRSTRTAFRTSSCCGTHCGTRPSCNTALSI